MVKKLPVILISLCILLTLTILVLPGCSATTPTTSSGTSTTASTSTAAPIKLLFATFLPPVDPQSEVLKAIGEALEERSNGQVKVEYSWGGALGKTGDYYDFIVNGACDVGFLPVFYVTGRFPMSDLLLGAWNLPNQDIATQAYMKLYAKGYFDKEYADAKPIYIHCGGGDPLLFSSKTPVTSISQMKGLKIRTSGGIQAKKVELLGGVPVSIAVPEAYDALQKGTVDGIITNWGAILAFKFHEVTNTATWPFPAGAAHIASMNLNTYNKLPKNVQAIIDEMWTSGEFSAMSGKLVTKVADTGKKTFTDNGGQVVSFNQESLDAMDKLFKPLWEEWFAEMDKAGLPGKAAYEDFYYILKDMGVEKPVFGDPLGLK